MKHSTIFKYIDDVARSGSIRRTAQRLNITPSALTRKIQDFEQELEVPVFERLSHGMRLNAAGELLVRHIRSQAADFDRLQSSIIDLSGLRRGHVAIVCSQAFVENVMPAEIEAFRTRFPAITFLAQVRDYTRGVAALTEFEADLALLVAPPVTPDMQVLLYGRQPLCAVMRRDHPLASDGPVRLRNCFSYPLALPDVSLAARRVLDDARARTRQPMDIQVESDSIELLRNYVLRENLITFQISVGAPFKPTELHSRPIDERDLAPSTVVLGQLRGRTLSLAASKFVDQLSRNPIWN